MSPSKFAVCISVLVLATQALLAQEAPKPLVASGPLTVWVDTPWQNLTPDLKPPATTSLDLRLAGARGGIASGVVIVSGASSPISAKAIDLKGPGGIIPVRLRYVTRKRDLGPAAGFEMPGNKKLDATFDLGQCAFLESLSDTPVTGEPIQPLWVTIDIPATAKAGAYQGTIAVQGKTVQVYLSVADFTVPPPGERRLYVNVHPSHDTVAYRYGVAPWSDQHFALLEPSLALAGRVGTNIMYVPIVSGTYFGHHTGMIYFTRKGEEFVPDFTAFDRYMALWLKHAGKPRYAVLNVWDADNRTGDTYHKTVEITVKNANGTFEDVSFPSYDKMQKVWKDAIIGAEQRLAKLGLEKYQILLGQTNDQHPSKETVAVFTAIDPDLRWSAWTHGYGYGGGPNGLQGGGGNVMALMALPDMWAGLLNGPGRCVPVLPGPKTLIKLQALRLYIIGWYREDQGDVPWRITPDLSADGPFMGYGPVGLDLWPLPPAIDGGKRKGGKWGLKRDYGPNLDRGQASCCTVAGPKGALSTTRLEGLAEGACEAEARLCIELAIAAKKLDPAVAKPILVARYKGFQIERSNNKGEKETVTDVSGKTPAPANWHESLAALYELAAKAQAALK